MDKATLESLETSIDELTHICARLAQENQRLREEQIGLKNERAALLEKTALARTHIEAMINRLKVLESDS